MGPHPMPTSPSLRSGRWLVALCRFEQRLRQPITSMPIDRAVPAIVLYADSSVSAFRSGILSFAMSSTCFLVTVPTLVLLGSFEPFARFAARFSRIDAGGVFVMKLYERSA